MNAQSKKDIITILEYHKNIHGTDSEKISLLIEEMRMIKGSTKSSIRPLTRRVSALAEKYCKIVGYDPCSENNSSREEDIRIMRHAISYALFSRFGRNRGTYAAIGLFFQKERTTIMSAVKKVQELIDSKDKQVLDLLEQIKAND